jgi:uncharacterized protein YggE
VLKKIIAAVLIAAPLAPFAASATDLPDYPFIHTSGSAQRYAIPPDFAEIDFEVSAYNPDPAAAREVVEGRVAEVRALLASLGLPADDFEIRDIRKDMRKADPAQPGVVQYDIKAGVHIKVSDLSKWKALMTPLIAMPNVDGFMTVFDTSKREALETELTADAIKEARRKAEAIAVGLSRKLGPVNAVSTGDLRNVSRAMGLASGDVARYRAPARNDPDREGLLQIVAMQFAKSVDVIFRFK